MDGCDRVRGQVSSMTGMVTGTEISNGSGLKKAKDKKDERTNERTDGQTDASNVPCQERLKCTIAIANPRYKELLSRGNKWTNPQMDS